MPGNMNNLSRFSCNKIVSALTVALAFVFLAGCEKEAFSPFAPVSDKMDFGISVFDEAGTEGSSFKLGTDITIALILVSDGGKLLEWRKDDECLLYSNMNFLLVYKLDESPAATPSSYSPVGTPYEMPVLCSAINLPPAYFSGGAVILSSQWSSNPDNMPLAVGKYYTTASIGVRVDGEMKRWELKKDFEIYF